MPCSRRWRALAPVLAFAVAVPVAPATPAPVTIEHDAVDCIVAGRYPQMGACVAPSDRVGRAQIHFRAGDSGPWYAVDMYAGGACLEGVLPKPLATAGTVEYFVDVIDRTFNETRRPERAPDTPITARVVAKEADCQPMRQMARFVSRTSPVVVRLARDASGRAIDAAGAQAVGTGTPAGFSPDGVVVAGPDTTSAPSSRQTTTTATTAAKGGGIAGLSTGALVAIGAGVVGAGVAVAAAAGGGGSDANGSTSGTASNLSGRWTGTTTRAITSNGIAVQTCTEPITLDLTQSGQALSGTITSGTASCTLAVAIPGLGTISSPGGSAPVSGTVAGSQVQFTFGANANCPPYEVTGAVAGSTITGGLRYACANVTETGTLTVSR